VPNWCQNGKTPKITSFSPNGAKRVFKAKSSIEIMAHKKGKTPKIGVISAFLASWKGFEPPACRLGANFAEGAPSAF